MNIHRPAITAHPKAPFQRGVALIVSLVLLLVLTILGLTAAQTSTLQERMAGNTRDRNIAFQGAEAALRAGEAYLQQPVIDSFDGSQGLYQPADTDDPPVWRTINWADPDSVRMADNFNATGNPPALIIEELEQFVASGGSLAVDEPLTVVRSYRVTARGTGLDSNTVVMLQTTFRRQ